MDEWKDTLRQIRSHLEYLRDMGVTELSLPTEEAEAQLRAGPSGGRGAAAAPQSSPSRSFAPPPPAPPPAVGSASPPPPQPAREAPRAYEAPAAVAAAAMPAARAPAPASLPVAEGLEPMEREVSGCRQCRLCEKRTQTVFGSGNPQADLMFVGEGPGAEEDRRGLPFVGEAGQLLAKIIEAMGTTREAVYIANVVKCRPPNNRTPMLDEIEACYPYLRRQIAAVKPKIIVALGAPATQTLLGVSMPISRMRGSFYRYGEIQVMPTFHPAYLLRNPGEKRAVWEDMQKVMAALNLTQGDKA